MKKRSKESEIVESKVALIRQANEMLFNVKLDIDKTNENLSLSLQYVKDDNILAKNQFSENEEFNILFVLAEKYLNIWKNRGSKYCCIINKDEDKGIIIINKDNFDEILKKNK